jgi:predicted nucleotidyltransferase
MEDFEEFIETLKGHGFKTTNQKYRVVYEKSDTMVGILPYGEIAEAYTLNFDERNIELSVLGFIEVGSNAEQFKIDDSFSIPTTPAHGIIILKLIAWNENNERTKDLQDIRSILEAAWELYQGELYTENSPYFDLLGEENFDFHNIASRIMGRKISPLLEQCEPLKTTVISILEKELENPSIMTVEMSKDSDSQIVLMLLSNLLCGIKDPK